MQASSQKGCSRKYVGHDKLSVVLLAHARQLLEKTDCCPQLFITVIAPGRHAGHFDAVLKDPEEFGGSVDRRRCSKVRRWRVNEIDEIRCIFPASREGRAGLRRPYRSSPDSPLEGTGFELSVPRCDLNAAGLTRAPGPTRAERRNCRLINASELTAAARDSVKSE